jgi:hypothetical protein
MAERKITVDEVSAVFRIVKYATPTRRATIATSGTSTDVASG